MKATIAREQKMTKAELIAKNKKQWHIYYNKLGYLSGKFIAKGVRYIQLCDGEVVELPWDLKGYAATTGPEVDGEE